LSKSSLPKIRGAANGKTSDEPRAQESECREATDQEICRTYIIQEAKKGISGLMVGFREIRAVTGFGGEL
jgi:hypothetical protein